MDDANRNGNGSPAAAGSEPIIHLHNVWKTYQTGSVAFTALRGINLDVEPGEFTAIMGPSGSGKSTLMNILGCLDRKDEGEYRLNGTSITDMLPNELARIRNRDIGFVFQSFNLLPRLNLVENVELPLVYADYRRRERRSMAMNALEAVGLAAWSQHRPGELSGGQKQRAAIARALILKPAILLADEPTGNLDTESSLEIMKLFLELNAERKTILLITHEADIAAYAQRVVTVRDGRLIRDTSGRNAPANSLTAGTDPAGIRTADKNPADRNPAGSNSAGNAPAAAERLDAPASDKPEGGAAHVS